MNEVGVNACKSQRGQDISEPGHGRGHGERPASAPPPTPSPAATGGANPATDVEKTREGTVFYPSSHPKWAMAIAIGRRRRDLDVLNR